MNDIEIIKEKFLKELALSGKVDVVPELLLSFSFEDPSNPREVSGLIQRVNHYYRTATGPEHSPELRNFFGDFLENLPWEKSAYLLFWASFRIHFQTIFSVMDIRKVYSNWEEHLKNEENRNFFWSTSEGTVLKTLKAFASEFDFSEIDYLTVQRIKKKIKFYCHFQESPPIGPPRFPFPPS